MSPPTMRLERPTLRGEIGRMARTLRKLARSAFSYARYPRGVTCLNCGFLCTGKDGEVSRADRGMLSFVSGKRGLAGCPDPTYIWCSRSLWIESEIAYSPPNAEVILHEMQKQRRHCEGFFRYGPGWSPSGHKDLLLRAEDKRGKIYLTLLAASVGGIFGSFCTLATQWLTKHLGLRWP